MITVMEDWVQGYLFVSMLFGFITVINSLFHERQFDTFCLAVKQPDLLKMVQYYRSFCKGTEKLNSEVPL